MRSRILSFASIVIMGVGLASLATPAQAETQAQAQAQAVDKDRHCVATVSSTTCYDTFTEAIAKATGGRVTDAPDNARAAATDPRLAARLSASGSEKDRASGAAPVDVLIAIEYEDSDFEDSTYTVTRPWGCTATLADVDWTVPSLPGSWNDQIGSYRTFSGCRAKHFEHSNFGGLSTAFDTGQADMGWMDDETSSIQYS